MSRMKETLDSPFDSVTETEFPEPRASGDLPPEDGDEDPGCPVCLSTNGFRHLHGERYACRGCGEVFSAQEIGL